MHHTSVWQLFPQLQCSRGGGQNKTKLGEKGWRRIKIKLMFSGDYTGTREYYRTLQRDTLYNIVLELGVQCVVNTYSITSSQNVSIQVQSVRDQTQTELNPRL